MKKFFHSDCDICDAFHTQMIDESSRSFFQLKLFCILLGSTSLFIGILNTFLYGNTSMAAALSFSVFCFLDYFILRITKHLSFISYALFDSAAVALLVYCLITGGSTGMGSYWILLLPVAGPLLLGKKHGGLLAAGMFFITVLLLWTPVGKNLLIHSYSSEFCLRFPLLYIAFFLVGYGFGLLQLAVYRGMLRVQMNFAELAEKDALTGLQNRFGFNKRFLEKYDTRISPEGSLALLMDIDGFKHINDTYGHLTGDAVLCHLSGTLRSVLGTRGMLCRWGGEEFFAFIPTCTLDEANHLCESVRQAVENATYEYGTQKDIKITLSIGAVYIAKNTAINVDELMSKADKNLYESKNQGKNRITLSQ